MVFNLQALEALHYLKNRFLLWLTTMPTLHYLLLSKKSFSVVVDNDAHPTLLA